MDTQPATGSEAGSALAPRTEGSLAAVAVYQLLAPLLTGRSVVEIGPLLLDSQVRLERAGAGQVACFGLEAPSLPVADASTEVVLCLSGLPAPGAAGEGEGAGLDRWLTEIRRLLQPHGMLVLRTQRGAAGEGAREGLRAALGRYFGRTDLVTENAFVGVAFFAAGTDDIAIGGDLDRLAARPTHDLLFCGEAAAAAPVSESLLIPLDGLRAELTRRAAWQKALDAERDELREQLLAVQEVADRRDLALSELRRQSTRLLEQRSDAQDALEALTLERDQAVERAQRAEKALIDLEATVRRREVEVSSLKNELSRLRARPR